MSQIVVTSLKSNIAGRQRSVSDCIHACSVEALGLPGEKRFHRFILLDPENFIHPPDRSGRYTIIDVSLFEGRPVEMKKAFIRLLFDSFERDLGIGPLDLEITLHETPRHNWGIRGVPGDELQLNYKVGP